MMLRIFHIIILVVFYMHCHAQSIKESNFKLYTTDQGLTDNSITGIVQDSGGFVWIATSRGLNRFDGNTFKSFLKSGKYNAIPDNAIFSMNLFGDLLTIATDDGAQIISTKTLKQINLNVPTSDALRYWSNACMYTHIDRDGNFGLSTKTGFYIFSPMGKLISRYDRYTDKDIGNSWMMFGRHIYNFPGGNMMQLNDSGILIYDRDEKIIVDASGYSQGFKNLVPSLIKSRYLFFFISTYDLLLVNMENNSFDIIDIRNGHTKSIPSCFKLKDEIGWQTKPNRIYDGYWALNSRQSGFFLLNIDTIARTVSCSQTKYFSNQFCSTIFSDKQKRLWVGTSKGLYMENLHPKTINSFAISLNDKDNFSITSLFIAENKIFAGTNHKEILILDKKTGEIIRRIQLPLEQGLSNIITYMLPADKDTLWVSSSSGLMWLNIHDFTYGKLMFLSEGSEMPFIPFLYKDSKNNIWFPVNEINTIYCYNSRQKKFTVINEKEHPLFKTNLINSVAEDKEGNIWISGDAIIKWNINSKKIDTLIEYLPTQKNRKKGYSIFSDSNKELWTSLNDDGFVKMGDPAMHLRPENLIVQKSRISYINLVNNKIFVPTTDGIGYIDVQTPKAIILHHSDGLPEEHISTFHFVSDATDRSTWFACRNIICNIPSSTTDFYNQAPVLKINEASVLNYDVINYPKNTIVLKHNQNDIRLSFSAINFTDPENMRFAYRIKNKKDSSWIEAGNQPNILLTNISPGTYKIEFKVYAYDNKWKEQLDELEIIIKSPFWQTPLFLVAIGLLAIGSVYYLYRYRINQIRQKANLDKLLAQTEMKALHSQMNPHFIFNCLNSIREMILNNENGQASLYLSKFARLIRITLNHSSKQFVSLEDTLDYLARYLEMEQIRTDNFRYTIDVDKDLQADEIFLPPMLIQPFIENAIWHGASPGRKMNLIIQFKRKDHELICIVEDDGIGIENSLKNKDSQIGDQSVGISNIKQRIHVLNEKYNLKSTIKIEDKSSLSPGNTGTIVTLHLTIKTSEL